MKRTLLIFGCIILTNLLRSQTTDQYSFKFEGIYGNIIPHDKHVKALILNPVYGTEFSVEFQTMGDSSWQQFQGFPKIGVGVVWLNLGNPLKLGNAYKYTLSEAAVALCQNLGFVIGRIEVRSHDTTLTKV